MSDPRLHSLHLEGQPRREQFRAARQAIQAACGSHTLAGDLRMLAAEEKLDADARALLMDHAKEIKDSASDYRRLFTLVKAKLAKERGFVL